MKSNIGKASRMIRIAIAIIIVILYPISIILGTLGIILLMVASGLIMNGLVSICPLYKSLVIHTCKINLKRED